MPLRELRPADRDALEGLLRDTGMFSAAEVAVALELIDDRIAGGTHYRFVVAEDEEGQVGGYACFGPTPMTQGTWDLYWIAVAPRRQGRGVGSQLMTHVEREVASSGGRLLVVETAGRDDYAPTRAFYERLGYPEHARLRDFYRDGDDKVVHVKRLG